MIIPSPTLGGWGRRPQVDAPGSDACAGGSLALPARPQPPTACHPPWLAFEPGPISFCTFARSLYAVGSIVLGSIRTTLLGSVTGVTYSIGCRGFNLAGARCVQRAGCGTAACAYYFVLPGYAGCLVLYFANRHPAIVGRAFRSLQLTTDHGPLTRGAQKASGGPNRRRGRRGLTWLGLAPRRLNNRNPIFYTYIMTSHDIRACRLNNRTVAAIRP